MNGQRQRWTMPIHMPEARRFARTLTGCLLSSGAARLANLPEGYWALITTLIVVTQPSLTQALTIARDQIIGAFIGAAVGGVGLVAIDHGAAPMTVLAIALLPLAALAAVRPGLRLACVTLVIVVLVPGGGGSLFERPLHRVLEIVIGAASAFVATVLWPNRALKSAHRDARDCLDALAKMLRQRMSGTTSETELARLEELSTQARKDLADALLEAGREQVLVPILRGSADAIDQVEPLLSRLHRDALVFGQALADGHDNGKLQTPTDWLALPDALALVSDGIGATPVNQQKLQEAHSLLEDLQRKLVQHCDDNRENFTQGVALVMTLIVKDADALVKILLPVRKEASVS